MPRLNAVGLRMPTPASVRPGVSDGKANAGMDRTKKISGDIRAEVRALLKNDDKSSESEIVDQPNSMNKKRICPKSACLSIVSLQIPAMMSEMTMCIDV